ncbi:hypothetical protein N9A94_00655 [Akkermansiaceae bacterium]|nr:hypothetical protein [Akkermansiaceae bacterium]
MAQVSPAGGTFADKAIITEASAGETIAGGPTGGLGSALVHNFDTASVDPSYTITTATDTTPTPIGLSSGRHLVLYSTGFSDLVEGGTEDRSEYQTNLTLAGVPLAAGRSQGFIRETGGADECIMSGGAIINVAADNDVLTLETRRSDDDNEANLPIRVAGQSSIQLLRLDDSWDYLSVSRAANQAGNVGTSTVDVTYDTNDSPGTMGTAFSFSVTSGDVTLNESGLYLVFANTSIQKPTNVVRTNFEQSLTLDGAVVSGSRTTTYVRGNQDTNNGVTAVGRIVSATAGQVLNVEVIKETGGSGNEGVIQGGETALSIVKLPLTAKYVEVTDTTNQNVVNPTATVVGFNTLVSPSNATFTHSGGSTVTVNTTDDYLFLGSLFTQSDGTNDNHDRVIPIHGWQIDGAGGPINRGIGAAYNRDNANNRISGSWNGTLLELTAGQTVEMTSQNVGTASVAFPNTPNMQGLSISSLIVNNDPAISVNLPITVLPSSTGNVIGDAVLDTFDNDTPANGLTYTLDSAPTGGTLLNNGAALGLGDSFTQDDVDNNLVTFDAGGTAPFVGGFDFTVSDGGASDSSSFVINVEWPVTTVSVVDDGDVTEGGVSDFIFTADVAPVGADLTVTIAYSGTATNGADFTGATTVDILDGQTSAAINVTTFVDGLFEGAESITATITDVSGATITGAIGTPSSATFLVSDGSNSAPTGTNLTQVISGAGNVDIGDILVFDPDITYDSQVSVAGLPLFTTNGLSNETIFSDGRPSASSSFDVDATGPALSEASGFSVDIAFTPQVADLTGVVDIWEIGGSSNGSSILLIEGIPHLLCKANGGPADQPTDTADPGFVDLDWATGNQVIVPLSGIPLTAGVPTRIAVVFDIVGNQVKHSVNGAVETITALTPQSGTNWRGDHTVNTGTNAGTGTGGSNDGTGVAGTTAPAVIKNLANGFGAHSRVRFWNNSSGSAVGTPGVLDVVTATMTIAGWSSVTDGELTASSGNGEIFAAGIWTITGDIISVNAALAAVQFVTGGTTSDPTIINVSIEDGDEDGGGPLTGTILYTPTAPDPIYVDDDFAGSVGDPIADADLGAAGSQSAILGLNAFSSLTSALGAVLPTGTMIVNDGDYSSENIVIADTVTLQLTDTAGPVQIGNITTDITNSIDLSSNTLELGATNVSSGQIAAPISGTGNLTKIGTGRVIIWAPTSHTGTTTIAGGFLRIGENVGLDPSLQSELGGGGPVVVNDPGRLEFVVALDNTIHQTGMISGTGSVSTFNDGTLIFDNPGANTFSGGFELGDGATSTFDGVDQGAVNGFVVVNRGDHLGSGKILSRGSQLQAGSPGVVIPNDVDITGGGFRNGGLVDFELSGTITTIDGSPRGFGNYGLDGTDLTISGNIVLTSGATANFEASTGKDNGNWIVTGDISGPQGILVTGSFTNGEVIFSGNHTHTGTTIIDRGTVTYNATQTGGSNFNVNNDAVLTGAGSTTSQVTIAGGATLSPGNGIGTFTTGNLVLNGTLEIDADNNTPATGHDQVIANGTVSLGGASSLAINPGGGLTAGELVIIDNDLADVVTGSFSGPADFEALGIDVTVTYTGGDANDVAITFVDFTEIGQWRVTYYGSPVNSGSGANGAPAANGLNNLQNFALDLDPITAGGVLDVNAGAGTITSLGPPAIWIDPADGRAYLRHTRRTDFAAIPLTITDQFSRDLTAFEDSVVAPTVIANGTGESGAAIEAVQTELPVILPVNGGKARYGRIDVTTP